MLEEQDDDRVRFAQSFDAGPAQLLEAARQMAMEGVMVKRRDAPYVSGRTETWLKLKCTLQQEFIICGFTSRSGTKREVGALLIAYYQGDRLVYAGSVGTGWDSMTGQSLLAQLLNLEVSEPPLDSPTVTPGRWSRRAPGSERWVKPELVARVTFSEWTPDGQVRHPSFKGLREDLKAQDVVREALLAVPGRD